MGFECHFHYFPKKEDETFDYDKETKFKKLVGKAEDDTDLGEVAKLIIKQLARRDIFVNKVEVFEFTRKLVSFKQSKSGPVIKGTLFPYDKQIETTSCEVKDVQEEVKILVPELKKTSQVIVNNVKKQVIFDVAGDPNVFESLLRQDIYLTENNKYLVLREESKVSGKEISPSGKEIDTTKIEYVLNDDKGKQVKVDSVYFYDAPVGLKYVGNEQIPSSPRLTYTNNNQSLGMPVLRRS